ncbi:uroporphyrinogen-III synthase [Bacillus salitolerans]|uniref:Uroporphyrinogen-III synthase n=1 Tax=Bacillus salitolerans TaxID=1437434 RepID=A0ABW4LLT3_9BACI
MKALPLHHKTIVITRDGKSNEQLAAHISKLGGVPISVPLLDFRLSTITEHEERIIHDLMQYDWIVFTSANGVSYFFELYYKLKKESVLRLPNIAVVGEKTKNSIEERGFIPSLVPKEYVAECLIEMFMQEPIEQKKILLIKGNLARPVLANGLKELGVTVHELVVYETYCPATREQLKQLLHQRVDAITFTSPSTIKHFVQLLRDENWQSWINKTLVCCIGPITQKTALEYGIIPQIVPNTYTLDHLLDELTLFFINKEEELDGTI